MKGQGLTAPKSSLVAFDPDVRYHACHLLMVSAIIAAFEQNLKYFDFVYKDK